MTIWLCRACAGSPTFHRKDAAELYALPTYKYVLQFVVVSSLCKLTSKATTTNNLTSISIMKSSFLTLALFFLFCALAAGTNTLA
jgi:hypothetical protein